MPIAPSKTPLMSGVVKLPATSGMTSRRARDHFHSSMARYSPGNREDEVAPDPIHCTWLKDKHSSVSSVGSTKLFFLKSPRASHSSEVKRTK